jgi:tetratricopeptide (TPR) repeat protein
VRLISGLAILLALSACSSQTQTTTAPAPAETKFTMSDQAKAEFPKPDKQGKNNAGELVDRGRAVLKEQGKAGTAEAITLLTQATQENPRNADAYWELGWAQQIAGDFDGALKTWQTLRDLDPKYPNLESFTAIAVIRRGEQAPEPAPRRHDMKADLAR